jgi:hypothetical protein
MAQLPEILEWYSLTPMVNEMKSPRTFLRDGFFGDVETQTTENIVFSVLEGGRETAPFVKRDGEAIMAGGYDEKEYTIGAPNIRIKRPLEASDLIFRRHAGDVIFADGGTVEAAAEREIARQLQRLNELIDNAEEYLCALAIRGTISYTAADEANFTITYPKPTANTVTLTNFWDGASATPMQASLPDWTMIPLIRLSTVGRSVSSRNMVEPPITRALVETPNVVSSVTRPSRRASNSI